MNVDLLRDSQPSLTEPQRVMIDRVRNKYPLFDMCRLTRDGIAVMMTKDQFQEAHELRKMIRYSSMPVAEVVLEKYPAQQLELLHTELMVEGLPTAKTDWKVGTAALDKQVGGGHYKKMAIQPVEFIEKNNIPYLEGNAIKYICRHAEKGGEQDIDKAIHYLQLLKELRYGEPAV